MPARKPASWQARFSKVSKCAARSSPPTGQRELSGDTKRMAALPRTVVPPIDDPIEFRIELEPVPVPELCQAFDGVTGFSLTLIGLQPGEPARLLHKDNNVPSSRNCPLDYSFADLVTYYPDGHPPVAAILIHMRTVGFEGPDGRFLAVTTQLPVKRHLVDDRKIKQSRVKMPRRIERPLIRCISDR